MQKARQRKRLRAVDTVVAVVDTALKKQGSSTKEVERWKAGMPREEEMRPKDKYTIFDRKEKRYRKGIHREWAKDWLIQSSRSGRGSASGLTLLGSEEVAVGVAFEAHTWEYWRSTTEA
ncbi:MAG: hypothetical protein Q9207_007755 [Kuettlingeria erythrocarpa]